MRVFGIHNGHHTTWRDSSWLCMEDVRRDIRTVDAHFYAFETEDAAAITTYPRGALEWADRVAAAIKKGHGVATTPESMQVLLKWEVQHLGKPVEMPAPVVPGPRKIKPQLPVEVYSEKGFDAEAAWKAVQDLSKGN